MPGRRALDWDPRWRSDEAGAHRAGALLRTTAMPEVPCPTCGELNDDAAQFCGACGSTLAHGPREIDRLVGQVIGGRYHITRVLAEGGMGVVYAAEQKMGTHVRDVAVKTLLPELSRDKTTVARFYRECGTVAQLEHPNTIRVYDFGEAPDGSLFIAMEFVHGEPLGAVIERSGALPVARTLHILDQMGGALHEAHELGIVHRDLKPDNVILTERAGEHDFVKLLDFGIAARANAGSTHETRLTQQGIVLGTPPYMSPEQFSGGVLHRQSDIYSLGVIAYEMLSGRLPFAGETPWQWAHQHMAAPPPSLNAELPAHVCAAVMRALAKRPEERPASARDFVRQLKGELYFDTAPTAPDDGAPIGARTSPMPAVAGLATPAVEGPYTAVSTQRAPIISPGVGAVSAASVAFGPPPRRRRRGPALLLSLGGLLVVGAGIGVAVWWQVAPSPSAAPPLPPTTSAPPAVQLVPLGSPVESPITVPTGSPRPSQKSPSSYTPSPKPQPTAVTAPTSSAPQTTPGLPPLSLPPTFPPLEIPGLPFPVPGHPQQPSTSSGGQTQTSTGTSSGASTTTAACVQAKALAAAHAIEEAVAQYQACQQAGASEGELSATRWTIGSNARRAVTERAARNDCGGAQSAARSAASIGAGEKAQDALQKSGC
ncbi:MAG: protein kinase [Polyangiaceae bacterium]|nr:protein kinase [Polyangiaceae bacterium]